MMVEKESGDLDKNVFGSVWKAINSHGSIKYELFLPPTQFSTSSNIDLIVFLSPGTRTLLLDLCRPTFQDSVTVVFLPMYVTLPFYKHLDVLKQ